MNKIVRQNYPASKLPDDLQEGIDPSAIVTVTVELETRADKPAMSIEDIFARRRPPFLSSEEIVARVRAQRDELDE